MVRHADDAVEPLDLGYRCLDCLAARLVDDVEDLLEGLSAGFGQTPAGQLSRHGVHHLDAPRGIASDYAVADRIKCGAQLLFGLKEIFGAAAEDLQRHAVGDRRQCAGGCG